MSPLKTSYRRSWAALRSAGSRSAVCAVRSSATTAILAPARAVGRSDFRLVPQLERLVDGLPGQERGQQFRQAPGVEALPAPGDLRHLPPAERDEVLQFL